MAILLNASQLAQLGVHPDFASIRPGVDITTQRFSTPDLPLEDHRANPDTPADHDPHSTPDADMDLIGTRDGLLHAAGFSRDDERPGSTGTRGSRAGDPPVTSTTPRRRMRFAYIVEGAR